MFLLDGIFVIACVTLTNEHKYATSSESKLSLMPFNGHPQRYTPKDMT